MIKSSIMIENNQNLILRKFINNNISKKDFMSKNNEDLFPKTEDLKILYKSCFPSTTLKEIKDFKDLSFNLLKDLEKIGIIDSDSIISKVILDSSSSSNGERLIKFLRIFSESVLKIYLKIMKKTYYIKFEDFYSNNNIRDELNPRDKEFISLCNNSSQSVFFDVKKKSLLVGIINIKDEILTKTDYFNELQIKWKNFSSKITQEINDKDIENEIDHNKLKKLTDSDTSKFSELSSLDRAPKLDNCKYFYHQISNVKNKIINSEEFIENINFIEDIDSTRLFE